MVDRAAAGRRQEAAGERPPRQARPLGHRRRPGSASRSARRSRPGSRGSPRRRSGLAASSPRTAAVRPRARRAGRPWRSATACSGPQNRAIRWSARSCHDVTPPAVMRPSASLGQVQDRVRVEAGPAGTRTGTGPGTPSGRRRTGRRAARPRRAAASPVHTVASERPARASAAASRSRSAYRPRGRVSIGVYMSHTTTASTSSTSASGRVRLDEDAAEAAERLARSRRRSRRRARRRRLRRPSCPATRHRPTRSTSYSPYRTDADGLGRGEERDPWSASRLSSLPRFGANPSLPASLRRRVDTARTGDQHDHRHERPRCQRRPDALARRSGGAS